MPVPALPSWVWAAAILGLAAFLAGRAHARRARELNGLPRRKGRWFWTLTFAGFACLLAWIPAMASELRLTGGPGRAVAAVWLVSLALAVLALGRAVTAFRTRA